MKSRLFLLFACLYLTHYGYCSIPHLESLPESEITQPLSTVGQPAAGGLGQFVSFPQDLRRRFMRSLDLQSAVRLSACSRQFRRDYLAELALNADVSLLHPRQLLKRAREAAMDMPLRLVKHPGFDEVNGEVVELPDPLLMPSPLLANTHAEQFINFIYHKDDLVQLLLRMTLSVCPGEDCRLVCLVAELLRGKYQRKKLIKQTAYVAAESVIAWEQGKKYERMTPTQKKDFVKGYEFQLKVEHLVKTEEVKNWMMASKLLALIANPDSRDELTRIHPAIINSFKAEYYPFMLANPTQPIWLCYTDDLFGCYAFNDRLLSASLDFRLAQKLGNMKAMVSYLKAVSPDASAAIFIASYLYSKYLDSIGDIDSCLNHIEEMVAKLDVSRPDYLLSMANDLGKYCLIDRVLKGDQTFQRCCNQMIGRLQACLETLYRSGDFEDPYDGPESNAFPAFLRLSIAELILFSGQESQFNLAARYISDWDEEVDFMAEWSEKKSQNRSFLFAVWEQPIDLQPILLSRKTINVEVVRAAMAFYQGDYDRMKQILKEPLDLIHPIFLIAMKRKIKDPEVPDEVVKLLGKRLANCIGHKLPEHKGIQMYFKTIFNDEFCGHYLKGHPIIQARLRKILV